MSVPENRIGISGIDSIKRKEIELYRDVPDVQLFFCDKRSVEQSFDLLIVPAAEASGYLPGSLVPVLCHGKPEHMELCLSAGCSDYLCDPWSVTEMFSRIRRCLRSDRIEIDGFTLFCGIDKNLRLYGPGPGGKARLSSAGAAIFRMLVRYRGSYIDRDVLAVVAGCRSGDSRSVDMHISRLRKAINTLLTEAGVCAGQRNIIHTASRSGWGIMR